MEGQVKQKLCWNCDARVDYGVESCPSCGVYLSTSPLLEQSFVEPSGYQMSTYPVENEKEEEQIPASPYQYEYTNQQEPSSKPTTTFNSSEEDEGLIGGWKQELIPMALLLAGSVFVLFGIVLLFFARNGVLTLQWEGKYWYLYLLVGVPFLSFGWRFLHRAYEEVSTQ